MFIDCDILTRFLEFVDMHERDQVLKMFSHQLEMQTNHQFVELDTYPTWLLVDSDFVVSTYPDISIVLENWNGWCCPV